MDLRPTPSQPPSRLMDHLLLWGAAAATLGLFTVARDFYRGKAEVGDAVPFTLAFVATGYLLSSLPWIWRNTDHTRLAGLIMPSFMALVMAYFVLALRAGFIQPTATAIAVITQSLLLVVVYARSQ